MNWTYTRDKMPAYSLDCLVQSIYGLSIMYRVDDNFWKKHDDSCDPNRLNHYYDNEIIKWVYIEDLLYNLSTY